MKILPTTLQPYKRTTVFTAETVPKALLRDHKTKRGTWGLVHVTRGSVIYRIVPSGEVTELRPGVTGTIEPEVLHSVQPSSDGEFYVEFWR